MAIYLYGIVGWPLPGEPKAKKRAGAGLDLGAGVGNPPAAVGFVPHGKLAAVASEVDPGAVGSAHGVRALRRDMKAHSAVLNRLTESAVTVLPVQFGVMLPDEPAVVTQLLAPQSRQFEKLLRHVEGAVEVTLKATYVEEQALREVVSESPVLARVAGAARGRAPGRQGYQAKIELGKRVAEALRAKKQREARLLLDALAPVVRDVRTKDAADTTVLQASFLVEREQLAKFDQRLAALGAEAEGRMHFDCVGPLPPYSFADLRL